VANSKVYIPTYLGPYPSLRLGDSYLLLKYVLLVYRPSDRTVPSVNIPTRASILLSYVVVSLAKI
jgi:hypothetical protein